MATISDPTKLDKEELIAEWAVREEELRLQFESLKASQTQSQILLQRYERIFSFCPLPMLVIDSRTNVTEVNSAARQILGAALADSNNQLLRALEEASRLALTQTLRSFMSDGAAKAQELPLEFSGEVGAYDALVVSLDAQVPPDTFVLMLTGQSAVSEDA